MNDQIAAREGRDLGATTLFGAVPADADSAVPGRASVFDVCNVGVVLRAVLLAHGALVVVCAFTATSWLDWLLQSAAAASTVLPATLMWLVCACLGKHWLQAIGPASQWAVMASLGALCSFAAWWWAARLGIVEVGSLGALGPLLAGASLGAAAYFWLLARARMQRPAADVARLAELQSRIRPHFLFNALNSAIALVQIDPFRAETVLEDLAELFRSALADGGESTRLSEEIDLARRYLAIEQVRFGARLVVYWELESAAGRARVPPLLLQPLVENAIKHGIEPSAVGGIIRVRTRISGRQVLLTVTNTVSDAPSRPGHGIALRNVRERLRLLHDVAGRFEAGITEPGIYKVRIVLPLDP